MCEEDAMNKSDYKGIWVFAEQENGAINPAVFEIIGKAHEPFGMIKLLPVANETTASL